MKKSLISLVLVASLFLAACSNDENGNKSDKTAKETTANQKSNGNVTFGDVSFKTPSHFSASEIFDLNPDDAELQLPFHIQGAEIGTTFNVISEPIDMSLEDFVETKKSSYEEFNDIEFRTYEINGIQWVEEIYDMEHKISYSTMTVHNGVLYSFVHTNKTEKIDEHLDDYHDIIASVSF